MTTYAHEERMFQPGPLLEGRVAVVTAGAGGIGNAICRLFAAHGADLVVADIHGERTAATVAAVRERGRRAAAVVTDLTTAEGIAELEAVAEHEFGRADILVNGLGEHLRSAGAFEESSEDQWQALYEVNLLHVFRACRAFIPGMKAAGWGRIVNFSSVEGMRSGPAIAAYSAFKGAINSFTKSLAVDLARYGIRVNAIAVDKTRSFQVGQYELPEEYARLQNVWIPAGRYGEPEDVAKAALFLASDLCSWIAGDVLVADGGTLAAGGWLRTPKRWTNQPLLLQYFEDPEINERRPPMVQ